MRVRCLTGGAALGHNRAAAVGQVRVVLGDRVAHVLLLVAHLRTGVRVVTVSAGRQRVGGEGDTCRCGCSGTVGGARTPLHIRCTSTLRHPRSCRSCLWPHNTPNIRAAALIWQVGAHLVGGPRVPPHHADRRHVRVLGVLKRHREAFAGEHGLVEEAMLQRRAAVPHPVVVPGQRVNGQRRPILSV
eukprot:2279551-Prymnesium_polylepis.1